MAGLSALHITMVDNMRDNFSDGQALQEAQFVLPAVETFMTTALELVSAQHGRLLRWCKDSPIVEAQADAGGNGAIVEIRTFTPGRCDIPFSVVRQVAYTRAPAIVDMTCAGTYQGGDAFLDLNPHCTVIVLPLLKGECLRGMVILERREAGPAIACEQVHVLEMLARQLFASLEAAWLHAGAVRKIATYSRDEKALRADREMLLFVERINKTGSWTWDVENQVVHCSAEFCRIFEFEPTVSAIDFEALMHHIHPCDRENVRKTVFDAVAGLRGARFEHRRLAHNGEIRYLSVISEPITETNGKLYAGTISDISNRKADELILSEAQARLARGANLSTIGEMTALIAHEVNQPLMSISSNAGAALIWLERNALDTGKCRLLLREIVEQSQRAGTIIQRLQAIAYRRLHAEPVDMHALVRRVLLTMRGELDRHQIEVELRLESQLITLDGDAAQLEQVLANLVCNAIDAMHGVVGRARKLEITLRDLKGGLIEMRVEDNGIGTDAAIYEHMFEPFVGTKPDRMGMGLAICRSIIEGHGGSIQALAKQPHGCSVVLTMPEQSESSLLTRPGRVTG